jgi:hypothetical protein
MPISAATIMAVDAQAGKSFFSAFFCASYASSLQRMQQVVVSAIIMPRPHAHFFVFLSMVRKISIKKVEVM